MKGIAGATLDHDRTRESSSDSNRRSTTIAEMVPIGNGGFFRLLLTPVTTKSALAAIYFNPGLPLSVAHVHNVPVSREGMTW